VIIGHYKEPVQTGSATAVVEKLKAYLIQGRVEIYSVFTGVLMQSYSSILSIGRCTAIHSYMCNSTLVRGHM